MGKRLPLLLVGLFLIAACQKAEPSPVWDEFDSGHIDQKFSQKGPIGNYRLIVLQNEKGYYSQKKIVDFAASKGWKLDETGYKDTMARHIVREIIMGINPVKTNNYPAWLMGNNTYYVFHADVPSKDGKTKHFNNLAIVSADESALCGYNIAIEWAVNKSKK
jgi:hypothetical protein